MPDDNNQDKGVPSIKGVIKGKFDKFFWRMYQQNNDQVFKIINADAREEIGIANLTFKNGLQYLAQEGYIIYENVERKRDTEITLTEKYLEDLRKMFETQKSAISYAGLLKRDEVPKVETLEESQETPNALNDEGQVNPSAQTGNFNPSPMIQQPTCSANESAILSLVTALVQSEFDRKRDNGIQEISELRAEVNLSKSMINVLEMARRSQDASLNLMKDQIRHLEELILTLKNK